MHVNIHVWTENGIFINPIARTLVDLTLSYPEVVDISCTQELIVCAQMLQLWICSIMEWYTTMSSSLVKSLRVTCSTMRCAMKIRHRRRWWGYRGYRPLFPLRGHDIRLTIEKALQSHEITVLQTVWPALLLQSRNAGRLVDTYVILRRSSKAQHKCLKKHQRRFFDEIIRKLVEKLGLRSPPTAFLHYVPLQCL